MSFNKTSSKGKKPTWSNVKSVGESFDRVQAVGSIASGDEGGVQEFLFSEAIGFIEGENGPISQVKKELDESGLGLMITGLKALSGDPFAQIELGMKFIDFMCNGGFQEMFSFPESTTFSHKAQTKIVSKPQFKKAKQIKKIDDSNTHVDEVEIELSMDELVELGDIPLTFDGSSFEQLKLVYDRISKELDSHFENRLFDLINDTYQIDRNNIDSTISRSINQIYDGYYDPDCLLQALQARLDDLYEEKDRLYHSYQADIDYYQEQINGSVYNIEGWDEMIESYRYQKQDASKSEKAELNDSIRTCRSLKSDVVDELRIQRQQKQTLINERKKAIDELWPDINISIQQIKDVKARYKSELLQQKSELISELNAKTAQQRQNVKQRKALLKNALKTIQSTVIKSKTCNWKMCLGTLQGKSRQFDLSYSNIAGFKHRNHDEQASCHTCIGYKKFVQELFQANNLKIYCTGYSETDANGQAVSKECPKKAFKAFEVEKVIGRPKIEGKTPHYFDGQDQWQCKDCCKEEPVGTKLVPFIDLNPRVQSMIDHYILSNGVKSQNQIEASRFYYSVMYDILTQTVVDSTAPIDNHTMMAEANSSNYSAEFYSKNSQYSGSIELAGIHLLKHMLDLGEHIPKNSPTWTSGIKAGEHNQQILRNVLGLANFVGKTTSSSIPRQAKGVVDQVNIPIVFDSLTPEAYNYLQLGLDGISRMNCTLENFALVEFDSANKKKVVLNPFAELKTVFKDNKVTTCYYLNHNPANSHNLKFKQKFRNSFSTWLIAAQEHYKDDKKALKGLKMFSKPLHSNLDYGWIQPGNRLWNL
ncbi:MAG: hypothetical protein ACRCXZ_08185 [Patescibacteria group bacterium]